MNRRLAFTAASLVLFGARLANAQSGSEVSIGYQGIPRKAAADAPNGIQIAEGVVMHVGAGAETGYDTNVFYQDSGPNKIGSGIVRATGFAQIGNATRTGQSPAGLSFGAGAGLQYRRYLSDNTAIDPYRNAFLPSANLSLGLNSGQFGFGFLDSFVRLEDTPYQPGQQTYIRDNNTAAVEGHWAPGGGRLAGTLRYSNILDIFEDQALKPSSTLTHMLMVDGSWKWLPKTAIFIQVSQGYVTYVYPALSDAENKSPSLPLRAVVGLRGLITQRLAGLLSLGYMNGFYENGATTGGIFGSTYIQAQATLTPTLVSRVVVGYKHDFSNSVIGNFSYDDAVYASYGHQIAGRVNVDLSARYLRRNYQGYMVGGVPEARIDNNVTLGAVADYYPRNWLYAGVGYAMFSNFTNATLPAAGGGVASLDYVKQQVFARLGMTY